MPNSCTTADDALRPEPDLSFLPQVDVFTLKSLAQALHVFESPPSFGDILDGRDQPHALTRLSFDVARAVAEKYRAALRMLVPILDRRPLDLARQQAATELRHYGTALRIHA